MVLAERAAEIFDGPLPEPVHALRARRRRRSGATGSRPSCTSTAPRASRPSTAAQEPLRRADARRRSSERTGLPVVVNTSLNTAGRPMVDDPRDALECFGSAPVDLLAHRPVRRPPRRRCAADDADGRRVTRRSAYDVVVPTIGRPQPAARCSTRWRRRRPAARARSSWSTTGRDAGEPARPAGAGGADRPRRSLRSGGRGPAAARNVGWRAAPATSGSPSSTTTSCPTPGWRARPGRRPAPPPAATSAASRAGIARAAAAPTGARPTGSAAPPGWRTRAGSPPTWPTGATALRRGRRLRRALPARLPRGRRPGAAGAATPAGGSSAASAARAHPVRPAGPLGQRARAGRQRRRRPDAPRCTAATGGRAPAPRAAGCRRHLRDHRGAAAVALGSPLTGRRAAPPLAAARLAGRAPPSSPGRGSRPGPRTRDEVAHHAADQRRDPARRRRLARGCAALRRAPAGARPLAPAGRARRPLRPRRHARRATCPTTATPRWCGPMPGAPRGARPAARRRPRASAS